MILEIPRFLKKSKLKRCDYIIRIDIGSSYYSLAFSRVSASIGNGSHLEFIKEAHISSKSSANLYPKTPSIVCYNKKGEYTHKFGKKASLTYEKEKSNGYILSNFTPLLNRNFDSYVDEKIFKKMEQSDIVSITAGYLHDLHNKALPGLRWSLYKPNLNSSRAHYVLTTPSNLRQGDHNFLKDVVIQAGLVSDKDIDARVAFISSAQASVLYCEQYFHGQFSLEVGQRLMVCDAGGSTVNLTVFNIIESSGSPNEPLLNEVLSSSRAGCGSLEIDAKFQTRINKKFNDNCLALKESLRIDRMVDTFTNNIKPSFMPKDDDYEYFPIAPSSGIPSSFHDETKSIVDGMLRIHNEELLESVFDLVVGEVLDFIENTLKRLNKGERSLDTILVVGRFGQSKYLYSKITERFKGKDVGARTILQLPDGGLAACKGAVSYGLNPRMIPLLPTGEYTNQIP